MSRPKNSKNKVIHIWNTEEKEYLKYITPGHHHKEIQESMNKKFNQNFTLDQIKAAIARYKLNTGFTGRFEKSHIPANKGEKSGGWEPTQFKKGHVPINHRPVGSERTNVDGYIEIKVAEPNKWRCKHILVWEENKGPVPKGYAIVFGDSDKTNLNIDNLILVSRKQLLILNRKNLIQKDADLTRTAIIIADLYQKIGERKRK
jgi:Zn ribbon nucleic-acid-binding protein